MFQFSLRHVALPGALVAVLALGGAALADGTDAVETGSDAAPEAPALQNTIRWSTASEVDNFGFDVYRATSADGPFERLTAKPMLGSGTSDLQNDYAFVDDTIEPGVAYYYYVEEISLSGVRKKITPVSPPIVKGAAAGGAPSADGADPAEPAP